MWNGNSVVSEWSLLDSLSDKIFIFTIHISNILGQETVFN